MMSSQMPGKAKEQQLSSTVVSHVSEEQQPQREKDTPEMRSTLVSHLPGEAKEPQPQREDERGTIYHLGEQHYRAIFPGGVVKHVCTEVDFYGDDACEKAFKWLEETRTQKASRESCASASSGP